MTNLIVLKDKNWLENQKHAGKCVSNILLNCEKAICSEASLSLRDFEQIANETFDLYKCSTTFLNYNGFPNSICVSINEVLVHGIITDYLLQPGDVVSIDVGATFKGAIADAARTWIYKEPKSKIHVEMLEVCKKALIAGQEAVKIGNRLGAIGNAIYKLVSKTQFGLVTDYGGHGIGPNLHEPPFVFNKSSQNEGIRITNGLSIAIEPMVVVGQPTTKVGQDGFGVLTPGVGCHFENSVTLLDNELYILTE